jgi:NADPH:quinone reductase-like Zn-dependent oxidoreductase
MTAHQIQSPEGLDELKGVKLPNPQPGMIIPLSDGTGEGVAIGEGVARVKVGDRGAGIFLQTWIAGKLT